jgi:hypothetical protein
MRAAAKQLGSRRHKLVGEALGEYARRGTRWLVLARPPGPLEPGAAAVSDALIRAAPS